MDTKKSLGIILGGVLLLLAAGSYRWWIAKPETPTETSEVNEPEAPVTAAPPGPERRFQHAVRAAAPRVASVRTPSQPASPAQKLFVEWKGTWYAAELLASANGTNYIHYSGYGSAWDEWVTPERMRYADAESALPENPGTQQDSTLAQTVRMTPKPGDPIILSGNTVSEPQTDFAPLVQGRPAKGDLLVEWGKKWWPAEVLKQDGASYLIRYKGYDESWDEWVTLERIGHYTGAE